MGSVKDKSYYFWLKERKRLYRTDPAYKKKVQEMCHRWYVGMRKDPKRFKAWEDRGRKYQAMWVKKNPEKVREYQKRSYLRIKNDPVKWRKYLNRDNARRQVRLPSKKK